MFYSPTNLTETDPVSKPGFCSDRPAVYRLKHGNVWFETVADVNYGRIVDERDGPLRRETRFISRRKMSSNLLEGFLRFTRSSFSYP